ncbi:inactive ubiquitin carboxyl-terminal hydrolase MINDY-4B [Strix aluco]|uniref:inactive ubiquitin carboxyl-terminal hydrolase MINDY-4B n=1 Tax=Strix aluco TaxID=111821 RepID=UPI003DA21943
MGDREAELEEITRKISDLNKWREIFSFHGLEFSNTTHQVAVPIPMATLGTGVALGAGEAAAGDDVPSSSLSMQRDRGPPGAGEPVGPQPPLPPSAVPRPLLVPPAVGGRPISLEMAMRLRKLLFGDVSHCFSCEWANTHFRFRQPCSDLAYALEAEKGGTRAILMAVQAHVIAYLLFVRNTRHTHLERLRRVSRQEQGEALAAALADTLWAAAAGGRGGGGGGRRAVVCLLAAAAHVVPRGDYEADSFTERIQLFEFSEKAAAQEFIFDHINCFKGEGSHGVILFLYSLLFSRTLERVQEDLDCTATPLLEFSFGNITCTQAVLSLLLTGRAGPHDLDGSQEPGSSGEAGDAWRQRGPVGYLRCGGGPVGWQVSTGSRRRGTAAVTARLHPSPQASPGLRTPRLPVWLCGLAGRHGVLFGTDSQLLSDWKRERVFHLHFYNGQARAAHLTIDTHSRPWEEDPGEGPSSSGKRRLPVETAIRSKWAGASVSWNGTEPFF